MNAVRCPPADQPVTMIGPSIPCSALDVEPVTLLKPEKKNLASRRRSRSMTRYFLETLPFASSGCVRCIGVAVQCDDVDDIHFCTRGGCWANMSVELGKPRQQLQENFLFSDRKPRWPRKVLTFVPPPANRLHPNGLDFLPVSRVAYWVQRAAELVPVGEARGWQPQGRSPARSPWMSARGPVGHV